LADLSAAQSAAKGAVEEGTNAKQVRSWTRFQLYLLSIGLTSDPYLDNFSRAQKIKILGAFAHAIREGRYCTQKRNKPIKSESVRAALDGVAQAFKLADRADPRLDSGNKLAFFLQRQLRGYSSTDDPPTPQVAMTASILRMFYKLSVSPFDRALCELFIGAFFFAMRSCEYVQVSGPRKTKLLTIKNINFYRGKRQLHHTDPTLHLADCVSITFEQQKRDTKNDIITQHHSTDALLCPVKIWSKIIRRLITYPNSSPDTPINTYLHSNSTSHRFTGLELLKRIRLAASTLGPEKLGFTPDQLGLHSARSGAAMAMCLAGVPVFTIMLLGRWSSDAFLRYIRKQVKEFSAGISNKMIQHEEFFTIPTASADDPRVPNHTLNLASRSNNGFINFKGTIRPLASVFH
jgi:hypothetical protein